MSQVLAQNRGQLGTEPGTGISADACRIAWKTALEDMAARWDLYRAREEAAGRAPAWIEDDELTLRVGAALRAGDLAETQKAIATWQAAWGELLEAVLCELKLPPKLIAVARRLSAAKLKGWLNAPDPARREAARREIHARADQILEEVDGIRPPPNASVHRMFDEARKRFGYRDLEERSLTVWLRKNAPAVAALWPEAPVDAAWIDWRGKVGREHMRVLDEAWSAVTGQPRFEGGERP